MNIKKVFGLMLALLLIAGCATANPNQPDDKNSDPAKSGIEPKIVSIEPASLDVKVIDWGAPVTGSEQDKPQSLTLAPGFSLDLPEVKALPQEMQLALADLAKADAKSWLVVLYAGAQPSPSYSIRVDTVALKNDQLSVTWSVLLPAENTGGAMVMAYPYAVLKISGVELRPDQVSVTFKK